MINSWIFRRGFSFQYKTEISSKVRKTCAGDLFGLQWMRSQFVILVLIPPMLNPPRDKHHFSDQFPSSITRGSPKVAIIFRTPPSGHLEFPFYSQIPSMGYPTNHISSLPPQLPIPMFSSLRHVTLFGLFATRPLSTTPLSFCLHASRC